MTDVLYSNHYAVAWKLGVNKAPTGYHHPWLVVFISHTEGAWTREEARRVWRKGDKKNKLHDQT